MSLMKRQGLIDHWSDRKIPPGGDWEKEIDHNLETADIILLLVTSSFISSPYCWSREVKRALERHEEGECVVIPIILRSVDWADAPFSKLQVLPKDGRPVANWANRDRAYTNITENVREIVTNFARFRRREAKLQN